nr:zf-CCHC domain-containing protein/DUF4219 domain-containing protein/UBN2 domain-containing protein [Tanacetum cinerariifolium]
MAQENYVEGCSMKRPPLLEPNGFCFWKARFETYVKSKDIDLWQVIQNGDFYYKVEDSETKLIKEAPYELLEEDQKKKLGKNNEANMTLYNALPRKEQSDEDEEINLMAKNFRKLSRKGVKVHDKFDICKVKTKDGESSIRERGCYNCGNKNHLANNCPKPNNKAFVKVTWSDSEDGDEPRNDEICLKEIDFQ